MNLRRPLAAAASAAVFFMTHASAAPPDQFYWLNEMNKASAVMVVEQGIVPPELGDRIARAISQVIANGDKPGATRSRDYLVVEKDLIAIGGPDVTRVHSGRSRQDLAATSERLFLRTDVLDFFTALNAYRGALLKMAQANPDAIMPAYTWGVQAQPITYGHYLAAYGQALSRDGERLRQEWARLNKSPLGSAALGTSSFPVNRARLAALLGFDGVVENSLDAIQIAPVDMRMESGATASSVALTVGMMLADVTAQYGQTKPWFILTEGEQTGVSSIMPQKRNPSSIVYTRSLASEVIGSAQTYALRAHNVQAGMTDYKLTEPDPTLRLATRVLTQATGVMGALRFDAARALDEVNADYSTTTELADTLQRVADVPFRVGHHFASNVVTFGRSHNLRPTQIPYADAQRIYAESAREFNTDPKLPLDEAAFRKALTAENMVQASQGVGGPQPAEVARMLAAQKQQLEQDVAWVLATKGKLATASSSLDRDFAKLRRQ
ncbi:argininosuccinate lyase [Ramlibacter sp. G-1-2-2]|uniref:argininosuccinate lyase n=1 Tax=Ramlibacter agri TaxID=2728837 RepID=A0A848HCC7_9BURK|nr:lyase family protein [Ramlibacter agri]NML46173.1 argininosuccinate lyase [Ramlibacter agri]